MVRFLFEGLAAMLVTGIVSAESLETVLTRMDVASKGVQSFSADVKRTEFTAVLNEKLESTGNMRLRRGKIGVTGVVEFQKPDPLVFHFLGGKVEKFMPKAMILETYEFGKNSKFVDQYLALVFGVSGAELRKSYDVTSGGDESLGTVKTTRLVLVPRDEQGRKYIAKLELWIPEGQTYAIQEKVTEPSKDYKLFVYSNQKMNPPLADKDFVFVAPRGVTRKVFKN
ncbi:MAG: hypothetical protein ABI995_04975 [Acidobacteriota bacterium]